ncbi:NADPH-ferredoxin reductase FprA [Baekduia alba]|uniref:FAD-dependent oxidoreductase n=1 Tax=Baekduia alba TaxID=2997333 RepID=UPI00233F8288|nr:FAD-dependent oxidoreductase [Baekduia alba]WCB96226.1 NADPH-ferredoxin reductase FprA [Baekduia alba]
MTENAPDSAATDAPRVVIVGAGPSGFYAADQLINAGFEVDLLDALPTPFGLVRAGVAPDHPKIKAVTRVYEKTAKKDGFRFFGGVVLGRDVTRAELLERYHVVLYALGTSDDNRLGIPGEDRPGVHGATQFVGWYNGHPDAADHAYDLTTERAVVIGNGNVAIDVARMLVLHPDELTPTDTADHAIEVLAESQVKEVVLLGRRGPAQAAFTNPELRELADLQRAGVDVDVGDLELDAHSARWLEEEADITARKNVEILRDYAAAGPKDASHKIVLRFLRSPVEILGEGEHGPVTGVRVVRNEIQPTEGGGLRAVATGDEEVIEAGLVLRSIGYRGKPVDDVPFDERRGLIRNTGGRVCAESGDAHHGEYVVGWIKRGPSGVIGTNKKDAADTVARILEDRDAGTLNAPTAPDPDDIAAFYAERAPDSVTWAGWEAIDAHEKTSGEPHGRPRIKLVRLADLIERSRATSNH